MGWEVAVQVGMGGGWEWAVGGDEGEGVDRNGLGRGGGDESEGVLEG